MGDLADAYRREPKHRCGLQGCERMIPTKIAFCKPHWNSLDKEEKALIFKSLRAHGAGTMEHASTLIQVIENHREGTDETQERRH